MNSLSSRQPLPLRLAYHDACHLSHGQGVRAQPRSLLRGIPGVELLEIPDAERCCGSAGVYNLLGPESAQQIGKRKPDHILALRPEILVTANPGCTRRSVAGVWEHIQNRGYSLPSYP